MARGGRRLPPARRRRRPSSPSAASRRRSACRPRRPRAAATPVHLGEQLRRLAKQAREVARQLRDEVADEQAQAGEDVDVEDDDRRRARERPPADAQPAEPRRPAARGCTRPGSRTGTGARPRGRCRRRGRRRARSPRASRTGAATPACASPGVIVIAPSSLLFDALRHVDGRRYDVVVAPRRRSAARRPSPSCPWPCSACRRSLRRPCRSARPACRA